MKKYRLAFMHVLLAVLFLSPVLSSCDNPVTPGYSSNTDVISYTDFFLSADNVSLNTFVRGTIYVRGDAEKPEDRRVQITAWMEIDPDDWGGVSFMPPPEWKIVSIVSDYPQGNPKPESYITTLRSEGREEFDTIIMFGGTKYGAPEFQGGKGSIIIEFAPESPDKALPDIFKVSIGIGSQYDYIVNPVHEVFEVSLNTDYHDVSPYPIRSSPGNYLTDNELNKSGVVLKDVRAEKVIAEFDYIIPSSPEQAVRKGDSILLVTGHVQNMIQEKPELMLWAEGYGDMGKQVSWTLEGGLGAGRITGTMEYQKITDFALYMNIPASLQTIRLCAIGYVIPPPPTANPGKIMIPDEEAVVYEQALYMMGGANNELYIYGDGTVIYIEETGLRFASAERPATRIWHTGSITPEELAGLLDYLGNSGIDRLNDYYNYPDEIDKSGTFSSSDLSFNLIINSGGLIKRVSAFGYMSPDKGETYPGMPAPLDEIYAKLRAIAMSAGEVYQENVTR